MKSLKDITDDMLVDAIATFGFQGVWTAEAIEDFGDGLDELARRLDLIPTDQDLWELDQGDVLEHGLFERLNALPTRITADSMGYTLTPEEWGPRLAGLTAEAVTELVRGQKA